MQFWRDRERQLTKEDLILILLARWDGPAGALAWQPDPLADGAPSVQQGTAGWLATQRFSEPRTLAAFQHVEAKLVTLTILAGGAAAGNEAVKAAHRSVAGVACRLQGITVRPFNQ